MVLNVVAIESIEPMAFVSLLFNDSKQISCRKSLAPLFVEFAGVKRVIVYSMSDAARVRSPGKSSKAYQREKLPALTLQNPS